MLVFGHTGITLGVSVLLAGALSRSRFSKTTVGKGMETSQSSSPATATLNDAPSYKASWLTTLGSYIDIRLLLIGSLLPDIIDKPLGLFFFRETFNNGRIFCHTLLFPIIITLAGLYLYRRRGKIWLLVLSFVTFIHLICDRMWLTPQTLFWPIYGFAFEKEIINNWVPEVLYTLLTYPEIYVPELVGVSILIWFAVTLLRRRKIYAFIRYGQI